MTITPPPSPTLDEVAELDKAIRHIDYDLRRLKRQMDALQDKARRYRERRRQLTSFAPWINRLGADILGHIMHLGTQTIGNNVNLNRDRVMLPIAVSQVNRQWRQVALSQKMAGLWTYINMQEGRPYDRTILWLKRSRDLPIDIDLDYRTQPKEAYYQRNFLITLNVVIPFIHRWSSLRILAPSSLLETALHVFSAPAPNLQSLILRGWKTPGDDVEDHWSPTIFCRHTPRLQHVHLQGIGLKWESCVFPEMRDLTLSWIPQDSTFSLREFTQLVNTAAPSLQRLTILGSSPRPTSSRHADPPLKRAASRVELPQLQDLRLESLDLTDVHAFMSLLNAPYLRKLVLARIVQEPGHVGADGVDGAWRPRLDKLEQLECTDLEFACGLFESVCTASSGVRRLYLKGSCSDTLLEYLTPEPLLMLPDEKILLPKLERLEVHEAHAETVRAFVESRTATLREVKGSILNDRRVRKAASGLDAVRQLGWEHNSAIHVQISPVL